MSETRTCSACKVEKNVSEFHPRKDRKSGFRSDCKECFRKRVNSPERRIRAKEWSAKPENKSKRAKQQRRRMQVPENAAKVKEKAALPENKEKRNKQSRNHYHFGGGKVAKRAYLNRPENRQRVNTWYRVYIKKTKRNFRPDIVKRRRQRYAKPEVKLKVYVTTKAWRMNNPDKVQAQIDVRSMRFKAGGEISASSILRIQETSNCEYCGTVLTKETGPNQRHMDHILSLARGGTNDDSNLAASCRTCNFSKCDKILGLEWFPPNSRSI